MQGNSGKGTVCMERERPGSIEPWETWSVALRRTSKQRSLGLPSQDLVRPAPDSGEALQTSSRRKTEAGRVRLER